MVGSGCEAEVQEALDFALKNINANTELDEVLSARKQVFKGLNYNLTFTLDNGARWNAIVYRELDGNLSMTMKSQTPMPGGWAEVEGSKGVENALDFVLARRNNASRHKEIFSARQQVVKGLNCEINFTLENDSKWMAKVHRKLDGAYSILEEAKKQE